MMEIAAMFDKDILKAALRSGVVSVSFVKANGESREMRCTLNPEMIPQNSNIEGKTPKKENPEVQAVWDLEKESWRSFRFDSLTSIQIA
jgi:hypothetical protein